MSIDKWGAPAYSRVLNVTNGSTCGLFFPLPMRFPRWDERAVKNVLILLRIIFFL